MVWCDGDGASGGDGGREGWRARRVGVTAWRAIAIADEVGKVDVSLVAGRMSTVGGSDQAGHQIRGQTDRVGPRGRSRRRDQRPATASTPAEHARLLPRGRRRLARAYPA